MATTYQVFVKSTGRFVCEGTAKQCGDTIGSSDVAIREAGKRGHLCQSVYKVVRIVDDTTDEAETLAAAAKRWDAFCEPIRKKYNIPVYKAKPEVRG